ncbi:MAG TPA: hypothetical protein ENH91_01215 [Leeuwenhoekiella sp.]|nr:hypothetical protein [Leeuwenhoekiella sp.]
MKKVFLILGLAAMVISCSLNDDEGQNVNYELARITNVELPDTLVMGNSYSFSITSEMSDCSTFYGFQVDPSNPGPQDSIRYVGVLNRVLESVNCDEAKDTLSHDLDFLVLNDYTYIFNFLTGVDADNEPIYLTKTIPVKAR